MLLRVINRPDIKNGRWEDRLEAVLDYVDEMYREIDRALCSIDDTNLTDELRAKIAMRRDDHG